MININSHFVRNNTLCT